MWREPSFEKLQALVKALEKGVELQSEQDIDKLHKLKAILEAKAKAEGIALPVEEIKEVK